MNFEQVTAYLEEKFGIVLDWTSETALSMLKELAHRITIYSIVRNSIVIVICGAILAVAAVFFTKEIKAYTTGNEKSWFIGATYEGFYSPDLSFPAIFLSVILGISAIVSSICFFVYTIDLVHWIFIPEIQLFDYIKNLMA